MASSDPMQDRKYLLGARLAGLLINVGTDCVRQIFDANVEHLIKSTGGSLQAGQNLLRLFLDRESNKDVLLKLCKGPRILNPNQWALLYPSDDLNNVDSHTFDLTLLLLLIRNLKVIKGPSSGWTKELHTNDSSQAACLLKLQNMRNSIYGHITTTELSNNKYNSTLSELQSILLKLGATDESISQWKNKFNSRSSDDSKEIILIYEKLTELVLNDRSDMQALANRMIEMGENLISSSEKGFEKQLKVLEEMKSHLMDESGSSKILEAFKEVKGMFSDAASLFNNLYDRDALHNATLVRIESNLAETCDTVKQSHRDIQNTVDEMSASQSSHQEYVQQSCDKISECQEQLLKFFQNAQLKQQARPAVQMSGCSLFDGSDWKSLKDPFKILICTSGSEKLDDIMRVQLGNALGLCPWQVIIDIDYCSQGPRGLFDCTFESLRKLVTVDVLTYKNMSSLQEHDKDATLKGEKAIWILANGSEAHECEPCLDLFGKAREPLAQMLDDIVSRFPLMKGLFCVFLNLNASEKELKAIGKIGDAINSIYENRVNKINLAESQFWAFAANGENISHDSVPVDTEHIIYKQCQCLVSQLADLFVKNFGHNLGEQYKFPGSTGTCQISEEVYAQLKSIMELYHEDIGKIDLKSMPEDRSSTEINQIKSHFLKGNALTPEAIYLQEQQQEMMFVLRNEMKAIKSLIDDELKRRRHFSNTDKSMEKTGLFLLEHDASGGGTTCGKYLLYSFRNEYPCIEVKQLGTKLVDILRIVRDKSNLPQLLVIDNLDCQVSDIITLQRCLENNGVNALIVHIRRVASENDSENSLTGAEKKMQYTLSSKVDNKEDQRKFQKLYETTEKKALKVKVYLFGLYKFLGNYERIDTIVTDCISKSNNYQLKLLRMLLYTWKYVHVGLKLEMIQHMLHCVESTIEESLGCVADFLIYDNSDMKLRPANDCLLDPCLSKVGPVDKSQQITAFLQDMKQLSRQEADDKKESFYLLCLLFIQSRKTDQLWTNFIEDLQNLHGAPAVVAHTEDFLQIFEGNSKCAHLRTFLARYFMWKMEKPTEAIEQIQIALGVTETRSIVETRVTDMVLLSAYGNLHKEMMKQTIFKTVEKFKQKPREIPVDEICRLALEAVLAFSKAQKSTKTGLYEMNGIFSASTFRDEALVRYLLLRFVYRYKCGENHASFNKFVTESKVLLIAESLSRALEVLQHLDYLNVIGRVYLEKDEVLSQNVVRLKFDLLGLVTDTKKSGSDTMKMLDEIPRNMPCDFGFFLRSGGKNSLEDLPSASLEYIIRKAGERIQNRNLMLRANYRDVIKAMIYIRHRKTKEDFSKYSLKLAREYAAEWVKLHNKDIEAHFMLGILDFVQGINEENIELIIQGKKSLAACTQLCSSNPSMPAFGQFRYWIGNQDGLEKVLPYDKKIHKYLLQDFTGRQVDRNISVRFAGSECAFMAKRRRTARITVSQDCVIKFNIALAYDRILAFEHEDDGQSKEDDDVRGAEGVAE